MTSHEYAFGARHVAAAILPTLAALVVMAGLLHLLHATRLLPAPSKLWDPDTTVFGYQSWASRAPSDSSILLIGDSSCLTSVDAALLGSLLPGQPRVRNLGLFSGVSFRTYAAVANDYMAHHPGQVRAIVVLVTVGKLQDDQSDTIHFDTLWRSIHDGIEPPENVTWSTRLRELAGLELVGERLLPRLLARPLEGGIAQHFGFTHHVWDQLHAHHGSGVHVGSYVASRRRFVLDQAVSGAMASQGCEFQQSLPDEVKLIGAIMPVPEGYPTPGYAIVRDRLLDSWYEALEADAMLSDLPPVLPDILFANESHMNEYGRPHFTRMLARDLGPILDAAPR